MKNSCFECQMLLGVDFGAFWVPFRWHFGHLDRPRCLQDCPKSAQEMPKTGPSASILSMSTGTSMSISMERPAEQRRSYCNFASSWFVSLSQMYPPQSGSPRSVVSYTQQGWDAGEWDKQDIIGWQDRPPPIMGGILPLL